MAAAGADLLMLEMMIKTDRMLVTLEGAQTSGLPVWVGLSCKRDTEGNIRLLGGDTLVDTLALIQDKNVPLVSLMHTQVEDIDACLEVTQAHWSGPIGVYAHTGRFTEDAKWISEGVILPKDYASSAARWLDRGVQVIGGCCGIGGRSYRGFTCDYLNELR